MNSIKMVADKKSLKCLMFARFVFF